MIDTGGMMLIRRIRLCILKSLIAAGVPFMLSGCATWGQMDDGLQALGGKPIDEAFKVLGYPQGKQQFGSDTVYYWGSSSSGVMYVPQSTTTSGYVGNTPVYASTSYNQAVPINYNCNIQIAADSLGTIKRWQYNGNLGGCRGYIEGLHEYSKRQREPSSAP
jgi:hypothetical protein